MLVGWRQFRAGLRDLEFRRQRLVVQSFRWQTTTKLFHPRFIQWALPQPGERIGIVEDHGHTIVKSRHKLIGLSGNHRKRIAFLQAGEEELLKVFHGEEDFAFRPYRTKTGLKVAGGGNEAAAFLGRKTPRVAAELILRAFVTNLVRGFVAP